MYAVHNVILMMNSMLLASMNDEQECDAEFYMQLFLFIIVWAQHYLEEVDEFRPIQRLPPRIPRARYNFQTSTQDPIELFRFNEHELRYIVMLMREPHWHRTASRDKFSLLEGLCIMTRRLCYPARWADLVHVFGRSVSALGRIFHYMLTLMINKYAHLLQFDVTRFVNKLPEWAAAVARICPNTYNTVCMFLDGTHQRTCRPHPTNVPDGISHDDIQRSQFDGRLHKHGQKYHLVVAPNGVMTHGYGPVDGRRHDTTVLRLSGLARLLETLSINGIDYCIYADSAYAITPNMQVPVKNPAPNSVGRRVNRIMARARTVASECGFSAVTNTWQWVDWTRQQKIFWTRPADCYIVAVLLTNMRLCLRRFNVMSEFFNLSDTCPTLSDYLSGNWN